MFEDINQSTHDLWVSSWKCILHIIDMLEAIIESEFKNNKLKIDYLYEVFTSAIFYNYNRVQCEFENMEENLLVPVRKEDLK